MKNKESFLQLLSYIASSSYFAKENEDYVYYIIRSSRRSGHITVYVPFYVNGVQVKLKKLNGKL